MSKIFLILALIFNLVFVWAAGAETIRAKTVITSYRGYLQHPAPGEDEFTIVLWKTDPRIPGPKEGTKIIFEEAVLDSIDSMGSIDDLQFKEVILRDGTFQIIGKKIICISLGSEDIIDVENLRLSAEDAEERLNQLALSVEGYISLGPNSLLIYKNSTGEEFLENINFDEKTLWLNFPEDRDYLAEIINQKKKVRVKVGWRPKTSENIDTGSVPSNNDDYTAGYINISILE